VEVEMGFLKIFGIAVLAVVVVLVLVEIFWPYLSLKSI
jgi:hypothetical protein